MLVAIWVIAATAGTLNIQELLTENASGRHSCLVWLGLCPGLCGENAAGSVPRLAAPAI